MVLARDFLLILSRLVRPESRSGAIAQLTEALGVDEFFLFITDPEIGVLLAAPGFPQTYPHGERWREFVEQCNPWTPSRAELPWPDAKFLRPAVGVRADNDAVVVLLGGAPSASNLEQLTMLLPLLSAALASERALAAAAVQTQLAQEAARESATLAMGIDEARRAAQREIAARREIEQALRQAKDLLARANEELEARVHERTTRLRDTVAELEAFSYSISHDMRSPLRAMQGYAKLLVQESSSKLDPAEQDYLRRIARASERLDRLINDVLRYTRVARTDAEQERIDLEQLLQDVIQQYSPLHEPAANIEVTRPLLPVLGHEVLLVQCVSNLLTNAVKFVPEGVKPHVRVWTKPVGDRVRLSIADNGIGIAPADQKRIFRIFERINPDREFDGTGIGLAIVKRAAERLDAEIGVESVLGAGSRFWLLLHAAPPL